MTPTPLFLTDALQPVLDWFGVQQVSVVLFIGALVLYSRKGLKLGSLLGDWVGKVTFAAGVILLLLITGIIPGINVDAAVVLVRAIWDLGASIVSGVLG